MDHWAPGTSSKHPARHSPPDEAALAGILGLSSLATHGHLRPVGVLLMRNRATPSALLLFGIAAWVVNPLAAGGDGPVFVGDAELRTRVDQAVLASWEGVTRVAVSPPYDLAQVEDLRWGLPSGGVMVARLFPFAGVKAAEKKHHELLRRLSVSPHSRPPIGDLAFSWSADEFCQVYFRVGTVAITLKGRSLGEQGHEICDRFAHAIAEETASVLRERAD